MSSRARRKNVLANLALQYTSVSWKTLSWKMSSSASLVFQHSFGKRAAWLCPAVFRRKMSIWVLSMPFLLAKHKQCYNVHAKVFQIRTITFALDPFLSGILLQIIRLHRSWGKGCWHNALKHMTKCCRARVLARSGLSPANVRTFGGRILCVCGAPIFFCSRRNWPKDWTTTTVAKCLHRTVSRLVVVAQCPIGRQQGWWLIFIAVQT